MLPNLFLIDVALYIHTILKNILYVQYMLEFKSSAFSHFYAANPFSLVGSSHLCIEWQLAFAPLCLCMTFVWLALDL